MLLLQDLPSLFFPPNVRWLPVFLKFSKTSSSISLETTDLSNISLRSAESWSIYIPSMTLGFRDKQVKIGSSSLPNRLGPVEEPHVGGLDTSPWISTSGCAEDRLRFSLEVRRGYVILLDNEP